LNYPIRLAELEVKEPGKRLFQSTPERLAGKNINLSDTSETIYEYLHHTYVQSKYVVSPNTLKLQIGLCPID
jgi:hypothetical protein